MNRITVRLNPAEFEMLTDLSARQRTSLSGALRQLVIDAGKQKTDIVPDLAGRLKALELKVSQPASELRKSVVYDPAELDALKTEISKTKSALAALMKDVLWLSLPMDKKQLLRTAAQKIDLQINF